MVGPGEQSWWLAATSALPSVPALLVLLLLAAIWRASGYSWRLALLLASVSWGLLVAAITEGLSAGGILSRGAFLLAWTLVLAATTLLARRRGAGRLAPGPGVARPDALVVFLLALQIGLVAIVALVAWSSAPNNWDSHAYHLARVEHWLQNRSVAHYPTGIERQVDAPPWAEYVLAHFQILTSSDRLANFVQCYAMVGFAVAVSAIASALGARPVGQVAASAACLSLPMGILQGSSTQNDYVASFWLACFVALSLAGLRVGNEPPWTFVLGAGAALGLAMLTKGTIYIYATPFVAWFAIILWQRVRNRVWTSLTAAALVALLVVLPHWTRNTLASGSPVGPGFVVREGRVISYANDRLTLGGTLSNVARSTALQLGAPDLEHLFGYEPLDRPLRSAVRLAGLPSARVWNERVSDETAALLMALGVDPNDPATTWAGRKFHVPPSGWNFEDTAGNPLHLLAFVTASIWLLATRRRRSRNLWLYAGCCVAGFVLFNTVFAWQLYHSRLYLPLFVLISVFLGAAVEQVGGRAATALLAAGLLLLSAPWVVNNQTRPLLGSTSVLWMPRFDQYFRQRPALQGSCCVPPSSSRRAGAAT